MARVNRTNSQNVSSQHTFFSKVIEDNEVVVRHAIGMIVTIMSIWFFHWSLAVSLGADAKLFDIVPIIYIAHFGDLLAFLRFFWKMLKEF